jgi:phage N-6-adenine-methyltransferase
VGRGRAGDHRGEIDEIDEDLVVANIEKLLAGGSDDYETPQEIFDRLNQEFSFSLDAAATAQNAKCLRYFTREIDGLSQNWESNAVWLNPPFRDIRLWLTKARDASQCGATVVVLCPLSALVRPWDIYYAVADEFRRIPGQPKFLSRDRKRVTIPWTLALLIFRPPTEALQLPASESTAQPAVVATGFDPQEPIATQTVADMDEKNNLKKHIAELQDELHKLQCELGESKSRIQQLVSELTQQTLRTRVKA